MGNKRNLASTFKKLCPSLCNIPDFKGAVSPAPQTYDIMHKYTPLALTQLHTLLTPSPSPPAQPPMTTQPPPIQKQPTNIRHTNIHVMVNHSQHTHYKTPLEMAQPPLVTSSHTPSTVQTANTATGDNLATYSAETTHQHQIY